MILQIKQRIEQIRCGGVPKGYKKTKIGIVPSEWEETHLSKYLVVSSEKNTKLEYTKNDVFSISGELGIVNQIELLGRSYAGASVAQYGIVYPNDIVYTKSPLKANPYGIIKTNKTGKVGLVSTLYAIFHCKDNVCPDFVQYYFELDQNLNNYLYPIVNIGAKHDMKISDERSLNGWVIFPSLPEQEKIVEILSTQDKIIDLYQKKINELQKLKTVLLSKVFPKKGESIPEWRFPQFTDAWEQRKLGDVVGVYDGVHQTPKYTDGGIMFLSVENIATLSSQKYISKEAFERDYKVYPQKGDILMTRIGDVGTPNVVETSEKLAFYVSLALLKPNDIDSYFLCNVIQSPLFKKGLKNRTLVTAIPQKINKDEIGKVEIIMPKSRTEQAQIGNCFRQLDNLITLHQCKVEEMRNYKKSLTQLLLTGIVRVNA